MESRSQLCAEHHNMFNSLHDSIKNIDFKVTLYGNKIDNAIKRLDNHGRKIEEQYFILVGDAKNKGVITEVKEHTKTLERHEELGVEEALKYIKEQKSNVGVIVNWVYKGIVVITLAFIAAKLGIPFHGI
jgi:hypothetical protein